jgi:hypothetical protein
VQALFGSAQNPALSPIECAGLPRHSKTPILDLLQSFPRSIIDRPSNGLTYFLLTLTLSSLIFRNYPLLVFFVIAWLVWVLVVAVHEVGHLAAGWLVGLRFESVSVLWLCVERQPGTIRVRLRRHKLFGFADMSLDGMVGARRALLWFTAGGGIASLLLAVVAILTSPAVESHFPDPIPGMWGAVAYVSLLIALMSIIPFPPAAHFSDGAMIWMLLTSVEGTKYLLAAYGVGMQRRNGVDPFNQNQRWAELASLKGLKPQAEYAKAWRAYATNSDPSISDLLLEKCLSQAASIPGETREHLIAEAAYFCASGRNDSAKASVWLGRLNKSTILPNLARHRLDTAMNIACGNPQAALDSCKKGLQCVQEMPQGSRGRQQENEWINWKEEIEVALRSKGASTPENTPA